MSVTGDSRAWALAWAAAGWNMIPLAGLANGAVDKNPGTWAGGAYYSRATSDRDTVDKWCRTDKTAGFGIQLPFGIDVDDGRRLDKKGQWTTRDGGATLTKWEAAHGPLPATWRVGARTDTVNGIRLYLPPTGMDPYTWPATGSGWNGGDGGIDLIRPDYRHAFVVGQHPGSLPHPVTSIVDVGIVAGGHPRLYGPDGHQLDLTDIPQASDLPRLPDAWVAHMRGDCDCKFDPVKNATRNRRTSNSGEDRPIDNSIEGVVSGVGLPDNVVADRFRKILTGRKDGKWTEVPATDPTAIAAFDHPQATVTGSARLSRGGSDRLRLHVFAGNAHIGDKALTENRSGYSLWDLLVVSTGDYDTAVTAARGLGWLTGQPGSDRTDKKVSARDALVALAERDFRIGRTVDGRVFIVPNTGRNIALFGGEAKSTLASLLYKREGRAPGRSPLDEAWNVLQGLALDVEEERLPLRVSVAPDAAIIVDLGTVDGRCIRITPGAWTIENRSPVTFKRTKVTSPLPEPVRGGTIDALWDIVNVDPAHRDIVRAKLASDLFRDIPHPIVNLRGEQGAAKTTATWILTSIIDPSAVQTLSPPRDSDSWQTTANARWVIPVDNVSRIDRWWSDDLCRTATGAGDLKRSLYTDDDVVARITRGCVVLNGISLSSALRNDLAERMLAFDLHRPHKYMTEAQVLADFQRIHPHILGAVLDDAAAVRAALPTTEAPTDLRMADFAHVLAAFDATHDTKALDMYRGMHEESVAEALESDPIARTILQWMGGRDQWTGTSADLLGYLKPIRDKLIAANELSSSEGGAYWPSDAARLSAALTRSGALLAANRITYERGKRTKNGRQITLTRQPTGDGGGDAGGDADTRKSPAERVPGVAGVAGDADSPNLCVWQEEGESGQNTPARPHLTGKHTSRGSASPPTPTSPWAGPACPHGVPGGHLPDPLLGGDIPCPLCARQRQEQPA